MPYGSPLAVVPRIAHECVSDMFTIAASRKLARVSRDSPGKPGLLVVVCVAVLVGFGFLGSRGIWDPDEGRYTNVALNMVDGGDWVNPRRNDDVDHWTKPPLTYWAIAASTELFGDPPFDDDSLAQELAEAEPGVVFVVPEKHWPAVERSIGALGYRLVRLGEPYRERIFFAVAANRP